MDHKKLTNAIDKIDDQLETLCLISFFLSVSSKDMPPELQGKLAALLETCVNNIKKAIDDLGY